MSLVHITNGSVVAQGLAAAELPGRIVEWADALDVGPSHGDDVAHRAARAAFWAARRLGEVEGIAAALAAADAAVDAAAEADEVVLWYEHDLFDQLALCRVLARLAARPRRGVLTMVSIDRHPEAALFLGLGQLSPTELAALWPRRTPLGAAALDEAGAAWAAITSPDPRAVAFVARGAQALPYLAGALGRYLEELPERRSGLSRSERAVLALAARGLSRPRDVLAALHASDPRYVATDLLVLDTARTLAAAGLLAAPPTELDDARLQITDDGRAALAGRFDRVSARGIDAWRGGVRLLGRGPVWRWDDAERRVVLA